MVGQLVDMGAGVISSRVRVSVCETLCVIGATLIATPADWVLLVVATVENMVWLIGILIDPALIAIFSLVFELFIPIIVLLLAWILFYPSSLNLISSLTFILLVTKLFVFNVVTVVVFEFVLKFEGVLLLVIRLIYGIFVFKKLEGEFTVVIGIMHEFALLRIYPDMHIQPVC